MDDLEKYYAKWSAPDTRGGIYCDWMDGVGDGLETEGGLVVAGGLGERKWGGTAHCYGALLWGAEVAVA